MGIAFDGANMWVVNHGDSRMSVLRASDGFRVVTPTVGFLSQGIAFDGANMWVTNSGDGTVSKR
jgi:DNA-binding beta-propeller fold protein YncE